MTCLCKVPTQHLHNAVAHKGHHLWSISAVFCLPHHP